MSSAAETQTAPGPSGIGGWLILPILGFIGTIVLTVINLAQGLAEFKGLLAIFTASTGPLSALKIPVGASLVAGCLVIISASYCLYLIFAKKRAIVKFATAHYLILLCGGLSDLWAETAMVNAIAGVAADPATVKETARAVVIACIWIPYFNFSKRVRNTCTK